MATTKKSSAKKSTTSKAAPKKPAKKPSKVGTKATPIPKGREHQLAEKALGLVDQAAAILRDGIRESASSTAKSRIAAKKKANELLSKASTNLTKGIDGLQGLIGKL